MKTFLIHLAVPVLLAMHPALHAEDSAASVPPLTLQARCTHAFGDNAVFQQNKPIPVWGWSLPLAKVDVTFGQQKKSTAAGADGAWRVVLDPLPADKLTSVNESPVGSTLTIATHHEGQSATRTFSNILIGEVWLCSGQSNMAGRFGRAAYPPGSLKQSNYPALRSLESEWTVSTPATAGRFSRVAFCFGRELQRELMVPIGLMTAATGGSTIESWTSKHQDTNTPVSKHENFIPRILPLAGYAMRGTIWYQGEGNVNDKRDYLPKMKKLIEGWRQIWDQGAFPFYFVQLAPIGDSPKDKPAGGDGRAEIRNAQLEALSIPNTGMAVTIDIGDRKEHPQNKYDIGLRLARWALHRDYGRKDLVPCGPLYKSHKIEGGTIRVSFDHAQNGLMLAKKDGYNSPEPTPGAPMPWLSIQAKDGTWHWAEGKLDNSELIVFNKSVAEPISVRYAYTNHPIGCNLYNNDGLPAAPFTTCGY